MFRKSQFTYYSSLWLAGSHVVGVVIRLLDWKERSEQTGPRRMNFEKVIILKHLFNPKEFEVLNMM